MNDPTEYLYTGDSQEEQLPVKPVLSQEQRDKIIKDLQEKREQRRKQLVNQNKQSPPKKDPQLSFGNQNCFMKDPSEILVNTNPYPEDKKEPASKSVCSFNYSPKIESAFDKRPGDECLHQMHLEEPKKKMTLQEHHQAKYMTNTIANELNSCKQMSTKTKEIKSKREQDLIKECPFKPKINTSTTDYISETKNERMERLLQPKTSTLQKRERLKKQKDEEEFKDQCTFHPEISDNSKTKCKSVAPASLRLHHEADMRAERREKEARSRAEDQMKDCTFKPTITTKEVNQKPIYDRFKEIQKSHNDKIQKLRVESEKENQKLFKPKVNQKSNVIMEEKRIIDGESSGVVGRLVKDAALRIEKSLRKAEEMTQMQSVQYTFKPKVTGNTQSLIFGEGTEKDFDTRQQEFLQKQREKVQLQSVGIDNHCTFKPQINMTSEIIMEADPKRYAETFDAKLDRLSYKDARKAEMTKEMIEKEEREKYTYKPKINSVSKTLARQITVQEMADDQQRKLNIQALAEELKEQELKECKFKPTLISNNAKYDVDSHYKPGKLILKEIEDLQLQKKEKAEQLKRDVEYYQMLECSFKPKTNDDLVVSQKQVIVRGLDRHIELQELKKRQDKEKQEREDKVFGTGKGEAKVGYTIPEPFKLCTDKRAAERAK